MKVSLLKNIDIFPVMFTQPLVFWLILKNNIKLNGGSGREFYPFAVLPIYL